MPLITETYYLSLTQDNRGILRLRCSQDDTLRTVNLKLYNNGSIFTIPSGVSASVSGVKQNGAVFSKSCTISQDRKSVVLQLSSDITNVDGVIIAEIVLNDGNGDRLGTSNFIIQVEKNPIRAGVVQDTETPIEYINDFITQIQALTARLNNLITPSGDPSLAEVVDARISSLDGNTYQNLKARIDADIATLNTRKANKADVYTKAQVDTLLDNVEIDVDDEFSDESENPVQNKVVAGAISTLQADLGALTKPQRLADGTDLDTILTTGVYMLYANNSYLHKPTDDSEHGILEVLHEDFGDNTGRTFQRLTYTYKAGRTYIEIWVRTYSALTSTWSMWISATEDLNSKLMLLSESLQSQTGVISKVNGGYISLITDPVSLTPVADASWSHSIVSCLEGDKFIINAEGGQRPRAWGFLDSSNHVLSVADASIVAEDLELTAPANAVKLIINDRSGATSYIVGNNLASNKIDVQQNPVDFGKALVVGRDGKVTTGDFSGGLTDTLKVALLNCFKHVYWTDENVYNNYLALEAALYNSESRLTAIISYGVSHVFELDPLTKVKWLMLVKYDNTEVSPRDYTLTGALTEGRNALTVLYNNEQVAIAVEAEAQFKGRNALTDGDIVKFDGSTETFTTEGHRPPYLRNSNLHRSYCASKGHYPYKDDNDNVVTGKYPIPIPADAVHVRVAVAPHEYEIKAACWRYNNSSFDYTYIDNTDTGFVEWKADTDVAQIENNARALTVTVRKPNIQAFDSLTEPTEVVVQFYDSNGDLLNG